MLVILLNCITLGMYQPCMDDKCETNRCKILQLFDDFIFAFFSLEMTIKMVAMGVFGRGTYLADSWNRLDLFIVLTGAMEYILNVDNLSLSAVRTIRVLRPLRAINRIPIFMIAGTIGKVKQTPSLHTPPRRRLAVTPPSTRSASLRRLSDC
ncbi:hypothetical protein GEV33_009324 [Tenebrio molitor]|uniref:Ion transport domain-containing protein n=1 Tax=Tenebrio molitor TaxID=7067 RepID=A0A8J6HFY9_TENMO|nr:hypothetical protein GEV33_009324 [Tenebrio molitor]